MHNNQTDFQDLVWRHFSEQGRSFPWRETQDAYAILVSEIMLQQTQTERVVSKYEVFLAAFPDVAALAAAEPLEVLRYWQGLGYNRRGLALQRAAQAIMTHHDGIVPNDNVALRALPGVGPYTAGAVRAFAYNAPVVMIETNIRRVYLHHFFPERHDVADAELLPLIAATLDHERPRQWYQALMDYGAWLGKQVPNPNKRSRHYTKQSTFSGSKRQLRGKIVKLLTKEPNPSFARMVEWAEDLPERVADCVQDLIAEGFPISPE